MIIGIPIAMILLYTAWIIRCIKNAAEEKECEVTEHGGFEVNKNGELIETITATFHTV